LVLSKTDVKYLFSSSDHVTLGVSNEENAKDDTSVFDEQTVL